MRKIDTADAVGVRPSAPAAGTEGYFTDGDPVNQVAGTVVPAWWLNMMQDEVENVVVGAGLTPSKTVLTQLRDAINALISSAVGGAGSVPQTRHVDTSGLATGGGDLSANRTISVPAAAAADVATGTDTTKALTAAALAGAMPHSFAANGYEQLPNGLILQWGTLAISSGSNTVTDTLTFPEAFPNVCYSITGNAADRANGSWAPVTVMFQSLTPSGCTVISDTANVSQNLNSGNHVRWIAIGR